MHSRVRGRINRIADTTMSRHYSRRRSSGMWYGFQPQLAARSATCTFCGARRGANTLARMVTDFARSMHDHNFLSNEPRGARRRARAAAGGGGARPGFGHSSSSAAQRACTRTCSIKIFGKKETGAQLPEWPRSRGSISVREGGGSLSCVRLVDCPHFILQYELDNKKMCLRQY